MSATPTYETFLADVEHHKMRVMTSIREGWGDDLYFVAQGDSDDLFALLQADSTFFFVRPDFPVFTLDKEALRVQFLQPASVEDLAASIRPLLTGRGADDCQRTWASYAVVWGIQQYDKPFFGEKQ